MSELEGTRRSGWGRSVLSTGTRVLAGSSVKRRVKGPLASPGPAELVFSAVYLGPFRTEDGPAGETVANKSTFARFLQAIVWFFLQSKQRHGNVYRNKWATRRFQKTKKCHYLNDSNYISCVRTFSVLKGAPCPAGVAFLGEASVMLSCVTAVCGFRASTAVTGFV